MFDIDSLIISGHEKVIDHYKKLRDTAPSDVERERLQQRINKETDLLHLFLAKVPKSAQRAA